MRLISEFRSRSRHIVGPLLGFCVAGYFFYHALHGDRGFMAWRNLKQEVAAHQALLAELEARRRALEHQVTLLYPGSLDPDMLDERARAMLNYGLPDEIVIFADQKGGK